MELFTPVRDTPEKLQKLIIKQLKDAVLDGRLKGGDCLPSERELSKQLGVSRTSLREALVALEASGLIVMKHGAKSYIAEGSDDGIALNIARSLQIDEKRFNEILALRQILEPKCAAMVAVCASEQEKEAFHRFVTEKRGGLVAAQSGYLLRHAAQDSHLHLMIAKATGNDLIFNLMSALLKEVKDGKLKSIAVEGRSLRAAEEHEEIVAAILAGKPQEAEEAMAKHLRKYREIVFSKD